ncbi:hypothetical protein [Maritalea mediterranea]|uniref:Uncharacterized protein n=1 Tax=Maritalea mediterranea TaxID=2909667 RepID=A0ABS9E9E5_9HYPH|nr:hypothetical protein [Maritalea mediterranea]MCF4099418.1 hypothetical protein [Maritalea mediterranea]
MMRIDWEPPAPRRGLSGSWDKFVGPGATNAEEIVQLGLGAVIALALIGLFWQGATADHMIWHWVFVVVLALDIGGGIVTNATSAAKRWYHRKGHGKRQHFLFVCAHLLHLGLAALLFAAQPMVFFAVAAGSLLLGTLIILFTPLYLQRPVAFGVATLFMLLSFVPEMALPNLNWLLPLLALKLLLGHLVKEAPFQPEN